MEAASIPGGPALSRYAKLLPTSVLRAHVIMGAIQLAMGCLLIVLNVYGLFAMDRSMNSHLFSGIWTGMFFIPAGATGLAAGRGRKRTLCCIVSCLVLSVIAATVSLTAFVLGCVVTALTPFPIYRTTVMNGKAYTENAWLVYNAPYFTIGDLIWFLAFLFGLVVAIVQAAFACRASCCCVDEAPDRQPLTEFAADSAAAAASEPVLQLSADPAARCQNDVGLLQV